MSSLIVVPIAVLEELKHTDRKTELRFICWIRRGSTTTSQDTEKKHR